MSAGDHRIDAMTADDLETVLELDLAAFAQAGHDRRGASPRASRRSQLEEELARAWARMRVARDERGAALGYILFWHVADELHLLDVAVSPDAQRRGLGRALVEDLLAFGRAHDAARVLLEVRASNVAAIGLYRALGFGTDDVRKRYYDDGEDALTMSLALR